MNRKRNLWLLVGIVILVAIVLSGFVFLQPTAEDILTQTLESAKTITDGHAVVAIDFDSIEQDAQATIEVWAQQGVEGPGSFRVEVLDANDEKAKGVIIISDGETLWAYSPLEDKVMVGTPDDARAMMEANDSMAGEFSHFFEGKEGMPDEGELDHPENSEEAVQKLLEYFTAKKSGSEIISAATTNLLVLEPIPDQMPSEFMAVGGFIKLWIEQESNLPLALTYTGGSMGEFSATILEYEVNSGIDQGLFAFEVPTGAEIVAFTDLEPQQLTLEEAQGSAEFDFLIPAQIPDGATLVDLLEVQGTLIQRYTLPDGASFTITQGRADDKSDDLYPPSNNGQSVELRETTGRIFEDNDSGKILLTWTDEGLFYTIAGGLTLEQALMIAESLE